MTKPTKDKLSDFVTKSIKNSESFNAFGFGISTEIAKLNEEKAKTVLEQQLSAIKGKIIDDKIAVKDAEKALENAIYPTTVIKNDKSYYKNIVDAQNILDNAKDSLEHSIDSYNYVGNLLSERFSWTAAGKVNFKFKIQ